MTHRCAQLRDSTGKFAAGEAGRFDVERLPLIPGTVAAEAICARQPVVLVWADPGTSVAEFVVVVEPDPSRRDFVHICPMGALPAWARIVRQPCPQGAMRVVWQCPSCTRRSRHLFIGFTRDTSTLTLGCRVCLRLRFAAQGGSVIRKLLTRHLAGIERGVPIPRNLCVPTVITSDRKALRKFRNLVITEAPDGAPSGIVN